MAIKHGATDFIEKPIDSVHLLMRLKRLSEAITMNAQMHDLQVSAIGMKGDSPIMYSLFGEIIRAAQFACPVLIGGETGVGKELAARAIHRLSKYAAKNLISINCASVPKDLFEAELFGYERGAFTGANKSHKGYFEYADNNNLFMDEISQLPMDVQAKLLRVVSEGEIQKLGGKISKVNIRLISASNQNLAEMAEANEFRYDLLYRLNTINITIPPLRERIEDIPVLADYFVTEFCTRNDIAPKSIATAAKAWLCEQAWPGNVRELRNTIESGVIFTKNDHLTVVDFTTGKSGRKLKPGNSSLREVLSSFEKAFIQNVLRENEYNIRASATQLQMDKSNLFKKIAAHGIRLPQK
ncbi:MAG: sigma-54 dependent transcriptional regulator [Candidatus Cloacimonas sp.]|nr:sigma-54 dependent transcriptional regulator [Candidatus Cloacimonas sp.]